MLTATGSKLFSLLTSFHTTTFTLLSIFSPLEMISTKTGKHHCPGMWNVLFPLPSASQKRVCLSSLLESNHLFNYPTLPSLANHSASFSYSCDSVVNYFKQWVYCPVEQLWWLHYCLFCSNGVFSAIYELVQVFNPVYQTYSPWQARFTFKTLVEIKGKYFGREVFTFLQQVYLIVKVNSMVKITEIWKRRTDLQENSTTSDTWTSLWIRSESVVESQIALRGERKPGNTFNTKGPITWRISSRAEI